MPTVVVVNGPNLNLLGGREPKVYGRTTLPELEDLATGWGAKLGLEVETFQSNHEGALIDRIHQAGAEADGVVLNPGAFGHYSRALADAVEAASLPVVEVHISNVMEREPWRRRSVLTPVCVHTIYGRGIEGYGWALRHLANRWRMSSQRLAYGGLPDQYGDLRVPVERSRGLAILAHGGMWRHEWTYDTTEAIAVDLAERSFLTWNVEYRRVGRGGGWPESFTDIALVLDRAGELTGIEPDRTLVVGHSVGATMALWAAHHKTGKHLPALVVALAPITDMILSQQQKIDGGSIDRLLAGQSPPPDSYSPFHRLPSGVPALLVAAPDDRLVPIEGPRAYHQAGLQAGDDLRMVEVEGGHLAFLDPDTTAWSVPASEIEREFRR
ncbi:MAG: type II 3-dehydroquinate dehydratase [Actinomycetota bacterium]